MFKCHHLNPAQLVSERSRYEVNLPSSKIQEREFELCMLSLSSPTNKWLSSATGAWWKKNDKTLKFHVKIASVLTQCDSEGTVWLMQ